MCTQRWLAKLVYGHTESIRIPSKSLYALQKYREKQMRYSKLRGNTEALKQRPQRRAKLNTVAEIPDKRRALRDVPDI